MVEGLRQRPAQGCQQVGAACVCPQPAEMLVGAPQHLLPAWRASLAAVPQLASPNPVPGSREEGLRGAGVGLCPAALTLLQRRLDGKSGLTPVPKPAMLSSVPDGRLFRATSKASWGDSRDRGGLLRTGHLQSIPSPAAPRGCASP